MYQKGLHNVIYLCIKKVYISLCAKWLVFSTLKGLRLFVTPFSLQNLYMLRKFSIIQGR